VKWAFAFCFFDEGGVYVLDGCFVFTYGWVVLDLFVTDFGVICAFFV